MAVEIEKALLLVIALFLRMDLRHHSLRKSNCNLAGRFLKFVGNIWFSTMLLKFSIWHYSFLRVARMHMNVYIDLIRQVGNELMVILFNH